MARLSTIQSDLRAFWLNLTRAMGFVWQASPGWTIGSLVLQAVLGLVPLVTLYLLKQIVDAITQVYEEQGNTATFDDVLIFIILAGLVAFMSAALTAIAVVVKDAQENIVTDFMSQIIHNKAVEVDLEYYENPAYYDKLHRMQKEAPFLPTRILQSLLQGIQFFISLLVVAGWLFWFHWIIVPILCLTALPKVLVRLRYTEHGHALEIRHTPLERKASYLHELLTNDLYAKEIRLFSIGTIFSQRFQNIRRQLRNEELSFDKKWLRIGLLTEVLPTLGVFGMLCFVAYRTSLGVLTVGDLVVAFQAIQRGHGFLQGFLTSITNLYGNNLFVQNLHEFLNIRPRLISPPESRPTPHPLEQGIGFHNVSFCYPSGKHTILKNVSLEIRPGEHIALVGENGAGKTSLVKLLCRLYDPTEGSITLDDIDVREFSLADLRREVSVMFQDYVRYHLSARENIWVADTAVPLESERIEAAIHQAGAEGIITNLDAGYDAILGKRFEGGQELSIGEWQKIALARAFLRDSQILVLDEPTSAMDARAEYELFQGFHSLTKGRTAILISHRLSSVKMVDRIYVLEHGAIIESGTHQELMASNGRYAALFNMQAQKYQS